MSELFNWLDHFLSHRGPVLAIVAGLALSWRLTQSLKFTPWVRALHKQHGPLAIRVIAFVAAAVTVFVLWPGRVSVRLVMATVIGICAPAAYTYTMRVAYHFWPWLEPKMSVYSEKEDG